MGLPARWHGKSPAPAVFAGLFSPSFPRFSLTPDSLPRFRDPLLAHCPPCISCPTVPCYKRARPFAPYLSRAAAGGCLKFCCPCFSPLSNSTRWGRASERRAKRPLPARGGGWCACCQRVSGGEAPRRACRASVVAKSYRCALLRVCIRVALLDAVLRIRNSSSGPADSVFVHLQTAPSFSPIRALSLPESVTGAASQLRLADIRWSVAGSSLLRRW